MQHDTLRAVTDRVVSRRITDGVFALLVDYDAGEAQLSTADDPKNRIALTLEEAGLLGRFLTHIQVEATP